MPMYGRMATTNSPFLNALAEWSDWRAIRRALRLLGSPVNVLLYSEDLPEGAQDILEYLSDSEARGTLRIHRVSGVPLDQDSADLEYAIELERSYRDRKPLVMLTENDSGFTVAKVHPGYRGPMINAATGKPVCK